jgi:hypothetical protein
MSVIGQISTRYVSYMRMQRLLMEYTATAETLECPGPAWMGALE